MPPATPGSRLPPSLSGSTPVLASQIPLPPAPCISYAKYAVAGESQQQQQHKVLELARQYILNSGPQCSKGVVDSLLPIVCIGKDESALWVFAIGSIEDYIDPLAPQKGKGRLGLTTAEKLEAFTFDGLRKLYLSRFTPSTLYPCSSECASLQIACPSCSRSATDPSAARSPVSSTTSILPRASLRTVYAIFVDAMRDKLIDDICATSVRPLELKGATTEPRTSIEFPKATRLGNGFLSVGDYASPMWGTGWEHRSHMRPLVHTALHISLSHSAIHVRPLPTLTTLISLPYSEPSRPPLQSTNSTATSCKSSLPLTAGLPLILAPYQTPAFYVSTHLGNSIPSTLLSQFWDAMAGLGAYPSLKFPRTSSPRSTTSSPKSKSPFSVCSANLTQEPFILVLVPLTNPQGEPKGLPALWPAHLVFIDTSPSRAHLTNLPDMPGTETLFTPPRGPGIQSTSQPSLPITVSTRMRRLSPRFRSPRRISQTQRSFRALELSSHKRTPGVLVPITAKQAAGYVENVAREREKERERANQERVRRERDIKEGRSSGPSSSTPTTVSTEVNQPSRTVIGTPILALPSSRALVGLTPTTSSTSVLSPFFAKAAHGIESNSFYPSPPDWDPIANTSVSNVAEIPSLGANGPSGSSLSSEVNVSSTSQTQPRSNVASQSISTALDLDNDINLGMDIDMGGMTMSMGMNLEETMGFDIAVGMDSAGMMDGTFGSFTDDDFNYFDAAPAVMPLSAPHIQSSLDLGADGSAVTGWLTDGLHQRGADASQHPQQHANLGLMQEGTPTSIVADTSGNGRLMSSGMNDAHTSEIDVDLSQLAPDLIPSSPTKSPWSPGNPPTPSLELNPTLGGRKGMFEPIAFGESHRLADGKYSDISGKFVFTQQSPNTPQSILPPGSPLSLGSDRDDGWKLRYDAATDPRIGVVQRLRGIKRKLPATTSNQCRKVLRSRSRDEEWASLQDNYEDTDLPETSSESEFDCEDPEHGPDLEDDVSCASHPSRMSTPPPTGLPHTATLLYSHFHHAHLLPLGIPMRSSYGELISPTDPPPVLNSVPTPVSPAAALGNASERNKTLELLAQAVAKEAIENDIWAEAWAYAPDVTDDHDDPTISKRRVSQTDLRCISELLKKVDGLQGTVPLSDMLEPPLSTVSTVANTSSDPGAKLQIMYPPRFSIGRAGLIHHMLPPAVRFWEKEGLGPRGGTKDVVAFALFEEGEEMSALVERWMDRVSRAYNARGLGTHVAGHAGDFESGLVPLQFEAVRKTLPNLMVALPSEPPHIVLYVIAPPSVSCSLKSPALRTIIMSQKRVPKLANQHDFDQDRVLVHFVPDYLVADPHTYPTTRYVGLERFVTSVYDRLLRPTLRKTSRQFWQHSPPFENRFQVPAYVLARKLPPQTHLEWDERPSLNVLDRHMFLQVGYRLSACGKWLVAACIDERGEAHDVAVWGVPDASTTNVNWVVSNIWIFVKQFAQRADTEWRIVVAKLGQMNENEVEEWMSHLETVASAYPGQPVHVSLICAQNDVPLSFISSDAAKNAIASGATNSNSVFTDVSSTTYSAFLPRRTPIISPDLFCTINHSSIVAPASPEYGTDEPLLKSSIGVLPLCTTALFQVPNETDLTTVSTLYIHLLHTYKSAKSSLKRTMHEVHADITRNWHELAVLTRERWHFNNHGELPFHLAALQTMSDVLHPLASAPDIVTKEAEFLGV